MSSLGRGRFAILTIRRTLRTGQDSTAQDHENCSTSIGYVFFCSAAGVHFASNGHPPRDQITPNNPLSPFSARASNFAPVGGETTALRLDMT
jgi:hypothetical protein